MTVFRKNGSWNMADVMHHKGRGNPLREDTVSSGKGTAELQGPRMRRYMLMLGFILLAVLLVPQCRAAVQTASGRWAYILMTAFLVSLCMTPLSKPLAFFLGAVDWPDRRKNHLHPTPRLGGVAVFLGIFVAFSLNGIWDRPIFWLMVCSAFLLVLEAAEDIWGVPVRLRLTGQVILSLALMHLGLVLSVVPQHFFGSAIANGVITLFWMVGLTNAFNFFDGLDGLAAGITCIIAVFLGDIAFYTHQVQLGWLSVAVLGAVLGFLPYNFKPRGPAEVFLGDCGSTALGFILAGLAVHGKWAVGHPVLNLAPPLLIFGVLIYDMIHITVVRIRKAGRGTYLQWLTTSGKDHMHFRFESLFRSKRRAVFMVLLLCFCFGLTALVIRYVTLHLAFILVIQSAVILIFITILESAGNRHERRNIYPNAPRTVKFQPVS